MVQEYVNVNVNKSWRLSSFIYQTMSFDSDK